MINNSKLNNLFLSEQEKQKLYREILLYLERNRSNLNELFNNSHTGIKEYEYTINMLFEICNIEKNRQKTVQVEIILLTILYAILSPFKIDIIIDYLTKYTGENVNFISSEVNETIIQFKDITGIDLKNFSLVALKDLKIYDLIKDNEKKEVETEHILMIQKETVNFSENIFNLLINKFSFSTEIFSIILAKSNEIFKKLKEPEISSQISEKFNAEVIAGGIVYFLNFLYGIDSISYNQIYDNLNRSINITKETYKKQCGEIFQILMKIHNITYKLLISQKIKYITENLTAISSEIRDLLYKKALNILDQLLDPNSDKNLIIRSNINPKLISSAIIYLIPRMSNDIDFIDAAQIGRIINLDRKLITSYFCANLKERFNEELKEQGDRVSLTKEEFLGNLIIKYELPSECAEFAYLLLDKIKNFNFSIMDKTISLTIIYIISQIFNNLSLSLKRLCKNESSSEISIYNALTLFIPFLKEILNDIKSEVIVQDPNLNLFELELLTKENNLEMLKFCIEYGHEKLNLPEYSKIFSFQLVNNFLDNNNQIQSKMIKSIAGQCIYLSIAFFELQKEENIYPFLKKIGNIIDVHQDNIEKKSNLFKQIYFDLALSYLKDFSKHIIETLNLSKELINSANQLLLDIFIKFTERDKVGQRFSQFSISFSPATIFAASILKDFSFYSENTNSFIEEISNLISININNAQFEKSILLMLKMLDNEKFITILSFIYQNYIFPKVRSAFDIPIDKAPLLLQIRKEYPTYSTILWKRNYESGFNSVYYEDILNELGYEEFDKDSSSYFPYIGGSFGGSPPEPHISNLNKLDNFTCLKTHLKNVKDSRGFPNDIVKKIIQKQKTGIILPRISTFKIRNVRYKQRIAFEKLIVKPDIDMKKNEYSLDDGYIKETKSKTIYSDYANPANYNESEILGHGQPDHAFVLKNLIKFNENSVGIEIPIWTEYLDSYLTGHIDLMDISNDSLLIIDYKPNSFFHSLPQIAMYGLVIMKEFGIKNLECLVFNKDRVWIFKPIPLMKNILSFLSSLNIQLFWFEYVNSLLNNLN